MANDRYKARQDMLGELESIRTLLEEESESEQHADPQQSNYHSLDDQLDEDDPPILTNQADADTDEAPLLTEALNQVIDDIGAEPENDAIADNDDHAAEDIPVLDSAVESELHDYGDDEDGDYQDYDEDEGEIYEEDDEFGYDEEDILINDDMDADDLVARALRGKHKAPPPNREYNASQLDPSADTAEPESAPDPAPENIKATRPPEQQPSLFDRPAETPAPTRVVSDKTDNPFLPKHIRDRLHTNRTLQQEISATFTAPPKAPQPQVKPEAKAATPSTDEAHEQVIDELVQRYLPKIEAELREKLRALLAEQNES